MSKSHETKIPLPDSFKDWSEWDHKTFKTEEERVAYYIEQTRNARPWKLVSPVALSWTGWDMWKRELRKNFPVRHFIYRTLPDLRRKTIGKVGHKLDRLKWAFIHRYVPRHQYNVLRPSTLKPGYYDPTDRILHACMEELREFFEKGAPDIGWDATPEHQAAYDEMKIIYNWWVNEYPKQDDILDERYPITGVLKDIGKFLDSEDGTDSEVDNWRENSRKRHIQEEEWNAIEDQMLERLMKIRRHLWYL